MLPLIMQYRERDILAGGGGGGGGGEGERDLGLGGREGERREKGTRERKRVSTEHFANKYGTCTTHLSWLGNYHRGCRCQHTYDSTAN